MEAAARRMEDLEQKTQELQNQKEAQSSSHKAFFGRREELSGRMNELDKELFRLDSQKEKLDENSESLMNHMWSEYELTYNAAIPLRKEEYISLPALKKDCGTVKEEIRALGNVNVNAIEDYKEISERYTFMNGQRNDLQEAEEALKQVIKELDTGMKKQFMEQFVDVTIRYGVHPAAIDRWKKILGIILNIALLLLIDGLLVYTFINEGNRIYKGTIIKILLIVTGNILFLVLLFWGEKICSAIKNTTFLRIADVILLLATPGIVFMLVQMVTWVSGYKNKAVSTFKGLVKMSLLMEQPYLTLNLIIYAIFFIILIILFRKINIASSALCYLFIILAMVNYYVMEFRGEPFQLLDIVGMGTAAEVVGEYSFKIKLMLGIPLIYALVFGEFVLKFQKLELGKKSRKNTAARFGVLAVIVITLCFTIRPILQKLDAVTLWQINRIYKEQGYISSLVKEIKYFYIEQPEGYSVGKTVELAQEIEDGENIVSETDKSESEESVDNTAADTSETVTPKNIILIMNESLTDFENVGEIKSNVEILPYIRSLNKNVKHGQLHVPTFGAGTARSEYEALTGNSMSFLPSGSVPYQLYVRDPEYGLADILKSQGYYTIAMHPNKAHNWNRASVYPCMGFDEFISLENWGEEHRELLRNYVSDKATFEKIISLYEEKDADEKLFTFCVTMQNHGGYTVEDRAGFEPTVKLGYDTEYPLAETYLSLARESDSAFKELLEYFEKVDEPTMIVMFGDHWPKIEEEFMAKLLGGNRQSLGLVESQQSYTTPYVIWTNYPSETVEEDFSANYLGSYMLQLAGLEMPGYNQFLMNLKEQLPIIGVGAVCDKDGNWYANDALPDDYKKLMTDYNILEYNNQFEKKDVIESLFTLK